MWVEADSHDPAEVSQRDRIPASGTGIEAHGGLSLKTTTTTDRKQNQNRQMTKAWTTPQQPQCAVTVLASG